EEGRSDRNPVDLGEAGRIEKRRRPAEERETDERAKDRTEAGDLDDGSARNIRHAGANARLDSQENRSIDPAERLAEIVDAQRVEPRDAASLDHPDELHQ